MPKWNVAGERFQLLTTFKAIYESGSLTAAAKNLGVTQSAVSKQLQKLRDWFGDELFVRTTAGMEPTSKAAQIIVNVETILQQVMQLTEPDSFKPEQLKGVFTVVTTSEISQRLAPSLLAVLRTEAPSLRVVIKSLTSDYAARELETGKVGLVISVNWHAPEQLIQKRLFSDRFVCVMNRKHPLAAKRLTLANYTASDHILVAPLGQQRGFIDDQLALKNRFRRVRLSVPDFAQLNAQLLDEHHILTVPHRIALQLKQTMPIVMKSLPFAVPGFDYYMFWHKRYQQESAHRWLREKIAEIFISR